MMNLKDKVVASLDVDPQRTFTKLCPKELVVEGGDEIVDALNGQASVATYRVVSKDSHAPHAVWLTEDMSQVAEPLEGNYPHADRKWMSHAMVGTEGWKLLPGLPAETEYDMVVYKGLEASLHPYGACFHTQDMSVSTGLIEFFEAKSVDVVIVGGLAMEFCVMQTIRELATSGKFDVVLNLEATRAVSPEGYESVLKEIEKMKAAGQRVSTVKKVEA